VSEELRVKSERLGKLAEKLKEFMKALRVMKA
jgi:hypothetical protein